MNEPLHLYSESLPLDLERQVDSLCDEFEDELRHGRIPDADEYLARLNESAHRQLLRELTKLVRAYADHRAQIPQDSADPPAVTAKAPAFDGDSAGDHGHGIDHETTRVYLQRSLEVLQQIDDAGAKFESALSRGELLSIEEMVAGVDSNARPRLLRELLKLEMEFRAKKSETPSLREYRARFPDFARLVKHLYFESFIPERIGDFSVQRLLGRGGFGHVFQAWDAKLSRNVAIKVFRHDPDDTRTYGGGLLFEARTAAQLRHPGIVTVHAILPDEDGDEFLVLEFVDGRSLEDLLRSRKLAPHEAAELMLAVVEALEHSHSNGLVHRDLKPANILLDHGRRPRVTDFGLALHLMDLRRSPDVAGTLPYMAPEQASGETHRLDARTDLWAVGVTLYRSLTGWLPFSGKSRQELLDAIRHQEPTDLLQHDPTIPAELVRIVRRCLAKRMSDRYPSAAELADDLRAFLAPAIKRGGEASVIREMPLALAPVVPKGLRCFDQTDREFFLRLVPGPRDRRGVPEAVRFWDTLLQERDANNTFRVGLLYGPSGCGKSSLIRAGVVPQLDASVRVLVIEAAPDETERRLEAEIHRYFPRLASGQSLAELLAEIREGTALLPGEKLVIVIDQFEQWLHGWRQDERAQLVDALRQCDGGRVQALVLLRDDFWMPATRFFKQLDIPLLDRFNACPVDLFDEVHARNVLTDFGVAYGRLPADVAKHSAEQCSFLESAVEELSEDGWIMPVRLCIFVEMVKARPWTAGTLRNVGGTEGLGTAFLEEVFDSRTASPTHRLHRRAARTVLERLLPPSGTNIRGHLVAEAELRVASGYGEEPADFVQLMRCLDHELRLITPSDFDADEPTTLADDGHAPDAESQRLYQLTHDFLVAAIRGWLNQTRRRTIRGRAELRLAEYTSAYSARPESRRLPSWWEWLTIFMLTKQRQWKEAERSMMRAATRRYSLRAGVLAAAAVVLGLIIYDQMAVIRADGFVQALATSDSRDLPRVVAMYPTSRYRIRNLLTARLAASDGDDEQRVRVLLGLVATGAPNTDELFDQLLEADPSLSLAIAKVLAQYDQLGALQSRLWKIASDGQESPDRRLRASMALAQLNGASADKWNVVAGTLAEQMLADAAGNPAHFSTWLDGFSTVSGHLVAPMAEIAGNARHPDPQRLLAANVLARYARDDVPQLLQLALRSTPKQFDVIAKTLANHAPEVRPALLQEIETPIPSASSEEQKDMLASRKANAILLVRSFGDDRFLWPALKHQPDPRLRSCLLNYFAKSAPPTDWLDRLTRTDDPGVRQAMILTGAYSNDGTRTSESTQKIVETLLRLYREDLDPGVHGAAEWALRRLGQEKAMDAVRAELAHLGIRPGFGWYVTPSQITMTIVKAPGTVLLGSPETEPGRDSSDEGQWEFAITWSFAISTTEITQEQFLAICPDYAHSFNEFAPDPQCPINAVSWRDAQRFCLLLSERDGLPESEITVARDSATNTPHEDFLTRTGYRLPIEPEWEVACRAGTVTPRYYGNAPELLGTYAWFIDNSGGRASNVGRLWPNAFGLFDTLGNVTEWTQGVYTKEPSQRTQVLPGLVSVARFSVRGNQYNSSERMLRAANRMGSPTSNADFPRGFRIAHTIRSSDVSD